MDENVKYVKVFTPYHERHHMSCFFYYTDELGELPFGTVVQTSMKIGVIIDPDVPDDKLPKTTIYCLDGIATEKQEKLMEKEWWSVIKELHSRMTEIENQ